jgi:lipopolysaccharide/colanic/teichoic acid biosynthesis glycosyltransferase
MLRLLDILLSGIALIVLSPVLVPVVLVLRFTGEGEIFFTQKRIGLGGQEFGLFKFATMLKNSPNMGTGTVTVKDDPRVLPLGRFLRKTKINELPQLLNVFLGHMSVIGPRPQTRRCFDAFPAKSQAAVITVRPGLSGIGSIVFRSEEEILDASDNPDRVYDQVVMPFKGELEEWYTQHDSVLTYVSLIFLTVWAIVTKDVTLAWRVFPSLPKPDAHLARLLDLDVEGCVPRRR